MSLYAGVLDRRCRSIAFLGLAKNAGKTVAMNHLAAEIRGAGESLVLASIGRDGEAFDAVTRKPKPPVPVKAGDRVVTTDGLLKSSGLEAVREEDLRIETPLGKTGLYRITSPAGALVLAGVNRISDMKRVKDLALDRADRLLIDGAINRRSSGIPALAEGIIVSTGAVLGDSVEEVVRRTREALEILALPELPAEFRPALEKLAGSPEPAGAAGTPDTGKAHPGGRWVVFHRGEMRPTDAPLTSGTPQLIYRPGALTDGGAEELLSGPPLETPLYLAAEDPTRVFLTPPVLKRLAHRGFRLCVLHRLQILAVTINPHNPVGRDLPAGALLEAVTAAASPLEVFNVLEEE